MSKRATLKNYPEAQQRRGGCKVDWLYFASEADAKTASAAARHNARILEQQGYDWGYQSPGSIRLQDDKGWHPGLYEVCIP